MVYELEIASDRCATLIGSEGEIVLTKDDFERSVPEGQQYITTRDILASVEADLIERGEEVQQFILQPNSDSYFWIHTKQARGLDHEKIPRGVGDIKKILNR